MQVAHSNSGMDEVALELVQMKVTAVLHDCYRIVVSPGLLFGPVDFSCHRSQFVGGLSCIEHSATIKSHGISSVCHNGLDALAGGGFLDTTERRATHFSHLVLPP